jgi:hypothetical protein
MPPDESEDVLSTNLPPNTEPIQRPGRTESSPTAMGKYTHVPGSSDEFAREKREEIAYEDRQSKRVMP